MKTDWGGRLVFTENRASEEIRCAAEPVIPPDLAPAALVR